MPEFRAATTAYYSAMEAMATRLVPVVAIALDLPPDYFAEAFATPNCTIRLIHYPPHLKPVLAESRSNTGVFRLFHVSLLFDINLCISASFDTTRHDQL